MLNSYKNIGIIGGGQMAEALIKGIIHAGVFANEQISVIDPSIERQKHLETTYRINISKDPLEIASASQVLLLAVKPQLFEQVIEQFASVVGSDHLVISIMAGVTIKQIENAFPGKHKIIRVMPNTPALVLAAASAFSCNEACLDDEKDLVSNLFASIGTCIEVPESQLDAVTGLSGSGPGYIFTIIDALIDGGVLAGLPRDTAKMLVLQTVYGSAKLALENESLNPSELKAQVTSPGGTTIHGIQVLEQNGIRSALMEAVNTAAIRSKELGK